MCVILVCETEKPTIDTLIKCETANNDGGGIAWRDNNKVQFKKGLTALQVYDLSLSIELPFIIHFRMATVGDASKELCHPFSVSADAELCIDGSTEKVIMHNGHWGGWDKSMMDMMINTGTNVPDGEWSDSRAIAFLTNKCGSLFLKLLEEKVVLFSADTLELFGSGWVDERGIRFSNKNFEFAYDYHHTWEDKYITEYKKPKIHKNCNQKCYATINNQKMLKELC